MIKIIKQFLNEYKLILFGFLIFTLYLWNHFLRLRTSKTLPLNLSLIQFVSILFICIIFIYIVIHMFFPRKNNKVFESIIDWLFTPLKALDYYIKNIPFIKLYYDKILDYIIPKLDYFIIKTNIFYVIFWIFPRIILLTALFIDVFIFNQLHYKYMVILFGLLLFINRYFKYSLKTFKIALIDENKKYFKGISTPYMAGVHPAELEPNYNPNDPDEDDIIEYMELPLETFVDFQTNSIVYQKITREIQNIQITNELYQTLWEKHLGHKDPKNTYRQKIPENYTNIFGDKIPENYNKASRFVFEKIKEFKENTVNEIMNISLLLENYNYNTNTNKQIKNIKILIYINYLLCWLYVLIISIHTLNITELFMMLNETWLTLDDLFSSERVIDYYTEDSLINEIKENRKIKYYNIFINIINKIISIFL